MKFKSNAKYNEEPKTGSIFALKYNSLGIQVVWLLRHLRVNILRILVITLSAVFTVNFIRVSQIYSEKLMRRWKNDHILIGAYA